MIYFSAPRCIELSPITSGTSDRGGSVCGLSWKAYKRAFLLPVTTSLVVCDKLRLGCPLGYPERSIQIKEDVPLTLPLKFFYDRHDNLH